MLETLTGGHVLTVLAGIAILWTVAAACVAEYGARRGFSAGALLICALVLGFAIPLLAVTVADGIRDYG
jgi:hypothetical protein